MGASSETVRSPEREGPTAAGEGREAHKGAMLAWMQAIAPYGIFTTDADLNITSWNQWLVGHSGLAPEAVVGRPLVEAFPEIRVRRLDEHFRRALQGELSMLSTALHRYLVPLRSPVRGSVGPMLQTVRIAPLTFGEQVVGTIATIEDVTQREAQALIMRRQQEYDRLLSSALAVLLASENPLAVAAELFPKIAAPLKLEVYFNYLLAPDGSELRLHAAGGITPETRKAMATLKVGEGPCGTAALDRRPVHIRFVQDSSDEQTRTIRKMGLRSYAGFPLVLGDRLLGTLSFGSYGRDTIGEDEVEFLQTVAQYLALAIDRAMRENALRQAQQSLREHADELETKIAERTEKLHETIAQLESFTYTVAHDLRAPIRSLKGYSEILLSDYSGAIPADGQALLQRLRRASSRLDALTRDLLAFSKIARQDVQLHPVDTDELVHDILSATPALHGTARVEGHLGTVIAQSTLLQQCLANLFDNAVKFARRDAPLQIVVRSEPRAAGGASETPAGAAPFNPAIPSAVSGYATSAARRAAATAAAGADAPRIRIWIEDNGIGIPAQAHEKIFGIFERVSGLDGVEGTGIGLAIVARAIQQMGGACGVESTVGVGSKFWLELAAAPAPIPSA